MASSTPRGIRNNNPLNIRVSSNNWIGKDKPSKDKNFETFDTMEHGIRAAFIIIRNYINKKGIRTLSSIINTWAPANENNTTAYINVVSKLTNIPSYMTLRFEASLTIVSILHAMHVVENGGDYVGIKTFMKVYETYFSSDINSSSK